ncbi:MAG: hypothetical protein AABW88_04755 [Nanoarchaeota archaeon]
MTGYISDTEERIYATIIVMGAYGLSELAKTGKISPTRFHTNAIIKGSIYSLFLIAGLSRGAPQTLAAAGLMGVLEAGAYLIRRKERKSIDNSINS